MRKTELWQRMTLRIQGILTQGRAWKCLRKGTIYRGYRGLSRPSSEILRLYHQHLFNLGHYPWEGEYNDLIAWINQGFSSRYNHISAVFHNSPYQGAMRKFELL